MDRALILICDDADVVRITVPVMAVLLRGGRIHILDDKKKSPLRDFAVQSLALFRAANPSVFNDLPIPCVASGEVQFFSAVSQASLNKCLTVHLIIGGSDIIEPDFA